MYEDDRYRAVLDLARVGSGSDVVELVLIGATERVFRSSAAGYESAVIGQLNAASDRPLQASADTLGELGCAAWVSQLSSVPVAGPSAEHGWLVAASAAAELADGTEAVLADAARLIEDQMDRAIEQQQLDDLGEVLRRSQLELRETRDQLEVSNQELEQFAYIAAHELLAPMRSVAIYAEVLDSLSGDLGADEDRRSECRSQIRLGLQRMTQQVQSLLELSRAQGDQPSESLGPIELTTVVQLALDTHEEPLRESGATVELGDLPVVVGTAVPLQSVFANLISNAMRYRNSNVPLQLSITAEETADGHRVLVSDNGLGVEPEHSRRIFQLFERASTAQDGSGIGLALSRRILDGFGAKIGVNQNPGGGSVFWLHFPETCIAASN